MRAGSFISMCFLAGAVATASPVGPVLAAAPTAAERAFATFEAGEAAFRAADFASAARLFGEAFAVHPEPAYAYNRALALAKGENYAAAERAFRQLIEQFPEDDRLEEVRARLAVVQTKRQASAVIIAVTSVPAGAVARVLGGEDATGCVTPCELRADPGEVTVELANKNSRIERMHALAAGEHWELTADLVPAAQTDTRPYRDGAYAAWGVGAAGLVTGVTLGVFALNAADEARGLAADSPLSDGDFRRFQRSRADARDFALGADISLGVAVVGAVVGTVLWFVGGEEAAEDPSNGGVAWRF